MPRGCGYDVNGKKLYLAFPFTSHRRPQVLFLIRFLLADLLLHFLFITGLRESEVPEGGRSSAICATELSTKDRLGTGRGLGGCGEGACDLSEGPSPCVPGFGDIAGGGGVESRVAKTLCC